MYRQRKLTPAQKKTWAKVSRAQTAAKRRKIAYALSNARTGGFVGRELKFMNTLRDGLARNTLANAMFDNGTMLCLNGVSQGTGESQRLGRRMVITSIQIKWQAKWQNNFSTGDGLRVLLVLDKQTNGAQMSASDALEASTAEVMSHRNLENVQRFSILKDFTIHDKNFSHYYNGISSTTQARHQHGQFIHKFKGGLHVNFTGTGATVADIADNSLHCVLLSTVDSSTYFWIDSRIRFLGD